MYSSDVVQNRQLILNINVKKQNAESWLDNSKGCV